MNKYSDFFFALKYIKLKPSIRSFFFGTKALEYKVGPYGLLSSWYTLFIRRIANCDIKPKDGAT